MGIARTIVRKLTTTFRWLTAVLWGPNSGALGTQQRRSLGLMAPERFWTSDHGSTPVICRHGSVV